MDQDDKQLERIQNLIWKIQDFIGRTIPLDQIAVTDSFAKKYAGWYVPSLMGFNPWGRIITINQDLRGRQLYETVAHEVGHAFLSHKKLSPKLKANFTDENENRNARIKSGFFSGYARTDWKEDFCETFSAFVCNKGKITNIKFEGRTFSLSKDPVMKLKYMSIKQYLKL
jgi:hypothetical protein